MLWLSEHNSGVSCTAAILHLSGPFILLALLFHVKMLVEGSHLLNISFGDCFLGWLCEWIDNWPLTLTYLRTPEMDKQDALSV